MASIERIQLHPKSKVRSATKQPILCQLLKHVILCLLRCKDFTYICIARYTKSTCSSPSQLIMTL